MKVLKKKAIELRKKLFTKFYILQEGHPGSVFSILDFLVLVYYKNFIRKNSAKKKLVDDLIMSKGHATVGQYPILNDLKIISDKDWLNWGKSQNTSLKMFGNTSIPGIKVASGSLGHGIGIGSGIAHANSLKRVFVIISEGELYEGSVWESLFLVSKLKLKNLYIIVDVNNNIILGDTKKCLPIGSIKNKLQSFGITTFESSGHNFTLMDKTLKRMLKIKKPTALILKTIKGKGFKIMENKHNWHYWNPISKKDFENSLKDLNE